MSAINHEALDQIFRNARSYNGYTDAPVTPEDVVWSLERAADPKSGNPIQFVWSKVGNFKIDGNTITVTGASCQTLQGGQGHAIEIVMECEPVVYI